MSAREYWKLDELLEGGPGHVFRVAYVDDQDPRFALLEHVGQNTGSGVTWTPPSKPMFATAFRGQPGEGDWMDPREGRDDRIIYKLDEGTMLLKVLIALHWRDEGCEVIGGDKHQERGKISYVYNNFFGVLAVHLKRWDGKISGFTFDKMRRAG